MSIETKPVSSYSIMDTLSSTIHSLFSMDYEKVCIAPLCNQVFNARKPIVKAMQSLTILAEIIM